MVDQSKFYKNRDKERKKRHSFIATKIKTAVD